MPRIIGLWRAKPGFMCGGRMPPPPPPPPRMTGRKPPRCWGGIMPMCGDCMCGGGSGARLDICPGLGIMFIIPTRGFPGGPWRGWCGCRCWDIGCRAGPICLSLGIGGSAPPRISGGGLTCTGLWWRCCPGQPWEAGGACLPGCEGPPLLVSCALLDPVTLVMEISEERPPLAKGKSEGPSLVTETPPGLMVISPGSSCIVISGARKSSSPIMRPVALEMLHEGGERYGLNEIAQRSSVTFSASLCCLLLFSPRGSGTDFEKAAGGTEGARADEADS